MKDWRAIWRRQKATQRAWNRAGVKLGIKEKSMLTKSEKEAVILAAMHPGRKFSVTDDMAAELRRLHGEYKGESPEKIKAKVAAKIAREEAIERSVRKKFNPGYNPLKLLKQCDHGVVASEVQRSRVNADVQTIQDRNEMARKWGWFLNTI